MKKIEFESLKIRRATDIIENRISNMIIKGTVKPCEKLPTEKELSDQFDVSIVTIREALRGLEVAGLIEKKRGRGGGIYVTQINNDSVKLALNNYLKRRKFSAHHLAEVRLTVEPPIIRMIASIITPEELQVLEENISFCENKMEKTPPSFPFKEYFSVGEKNIEFHRLIAQATHNPVFVLTMDYVMDFIFDFKKSIFTPDIHHCAKVVEDHRSIFSALKAGDAAEAEARMLAHLHYIEKYQMNEGIQVISE
ncbi:MAG: FadR family transcriptional regulator [Dehalococcoidales bacterium]|nr:FadR family transcriptional regulator [Dehalococcoidales bacterium]